MTQPIIPNIISNGSLQLTNIPNDFLPPLPKATEVRSEPSLFERQLKQEIEQSPVKTRAAQREIKSPLKITKHEATKAIKKSIEITKDTKDTNSEKTSDDAPLVKGNFVEKKTPLHESHAFIEDESIQKSSVAVDQKLINQLHEASLANPIDLPNESLIVSPPESHDFLFQYDSHLNKNLLLADLTLSKNLTTLMTPELKELTDNALLFDHPIEVDDTFAAVSDFFQSEALDSENDEQPIFNLDSLTPRPELIRDMIPVLSQVTQELQINQPYETKTTNETTINQDQSKVSLDKSSLLARKNLAANFPDQNKLRNFSSIDLSQNITANQSSELSLNAFLSQGLSEESLAIDSTVQIFQNQPSSLDIAPITKNETPKMQEASFDAFSEIGERLRSSKQTIFVENTPKNSMITDQLITNQNQQSSANFLDSKFFQQKNLQASVQAMIGEKIEMSSEPLDGLSKESEAQDGINQSTNWSDFFLSSEKKSSITQSLPRISIHDHALVFSDRKDEKDENSSNAQSFSQSKSPSDFLSLKDPSNLSSSYLGKTDQKQRFLDGLEAPKSNMAAPKDMTPTIKEIFERASFLAKDGGGIVRLEIPSAGIGSIELAVNMQNDRLDLKILTANEKARDLMAAEMNQLRDALTVQNLQLGSVEVGVGRRDENRSSDLFSNFQQQQASSNQFSGQKHQGESHQKQNNFSLNEVSLEGRSKIKLDSGSYIETPKPLSDGRIAIRA